MPLYGGDTGWISMTLLNGWTNVVQPRYRIVGDRVYVSGRITGAGASSGTFFVLPVEARPAQAVQAQGWFSLYDIATNGTMSSSLNALDLDGLSFSRS